MDIELLKNLKARYDRGEVAVVQGVGYPNPDLSHFSSMAYWMYGKSGTGTPSTGWIGRWLDGLSGDELFRAATVGQGLPLHLIGDSKRGIAIPYWGLGFGGGSSEYDLRMYNALREYAAPAGRGPWHDAIAGTVKGVVDVGQQVSPVFSRDLPASDLEKKMTVVSRVKAVKASNVAPTLNKSKFTGASSFSKSTVKLKGIFAAPPNPNVRPKSYEGEVVMENMEMGRQL